MCLMSKSGSLAMCMALAFSLVSLAQAAEKAFRVCADPNNPPQSSENGQGYENKIAELFASELGQKLEYTWFPQRLGFVRNTLKAKLPDSEDYKCDVVMGVPTGWEMTATTQPYYRSTYVLVLKKGKGLDGVTSPDEIGKLPAEVKSRLRIAMFDGGPGTTWLLDHGLIGQGIPYQTMTGDVSMNTAQVLARDFAEDRIDMVITWGPFGGYIAKQKPEDFIILPMPSTTALKFDFPMSIGVRIPDKERRQQLDKLIQKNAAKIETILREYQVPLVDKDGKLLHAPE